MAMYGLFISWIYSRFFRVQDGIRGDRSESTPVKHLSNACFGMLVKLKICSPTGFGGSFRYDLENPQMAGMGHTFTQPGSLRAEAERRRALALKALDMRLHAAMGGNSGQRSSHSHSSGTGSAAALAVGTGWGLGPGGSGIGRSKFMGTATTTTATTTTGGTSVTSQKTKQAVSLLSLSAEPIPAYDDEDDDLVLFQTDELDVNGPPQPQPQLQPPSQSRTANTSDQKNTKDKE
ncbi:hypothetical protein BG004_000745 [Podila humilis]|nr:hypothetical protein BG004_000745 [Podila humilis]